MSAVIQIASPLPDGCEDLIMEDDTGRWPAVRFPNGEVVDRALALFWRYDDELWLAYEPEKARLYVTKVEKN